MSVENIVLHSEDHAIEIVNFAVVFRSNLDSSDEARFEERIPELQNMFAAIDKPDFFQFVIGNNSPTNSEKPVMYQLSEFSRDGKPHWAAQFGENAVAVSCKKYSNWEEVWPDVLARLTALLECVDQFKQVSSIEYSVTDAFSEPIHTDNTPQQLLSSNIFQTDSWVPNNLSENDDPRWDFQSGAFSKPTPDSEVLERIAAKSVLSGQKIATSVTNTLSHKYKHAPKLKEILPDSGREDNLSEVFVAFHVANKDTIKSILSEELIKKMGL